MQKITDKIHHLVHPHDATTTHSTTGSNLGSGSSTTTSVVREEVGLAQPAFQHTQQSVAQPVTQSTSVAQPITQFTNLEKPAVVQQTIKAVEREVVQPVIHRERQQTEIHQITQPLHQREVQPTQIHSATLPAEIKPTIVQASQARSAPILQNTNTVLPTTITVEEKAPIIEETVKKVIINEVQPVIQKEIIQPVVLQERRDVFEKVVEAPVVFTETRTELPVQQQFVTQQVASEFFPGQQPRGHRQTVLAGPGVLPPLAKHTDQLPTQMQQQQFILNQGQQGPASTTSFPANLPSNQNRF